VILVLGVGFDFVYSLEREFKFVLITFCLEDFIWSQKYFVFSRADVKFE